MLPRIRESLAEVRPLVLESVLGEEPESYSTWEHFTTRGHRGKVLSIASSDETDFIVSGGEDYTMRIWRFDLTTTSYDLCAVLWHDHQYVADEQRATEKAREEAAKLAEGVAEEVTGVTAVACAGKTGPFISGTSTGDLFVLYLGLDEQGVSTEEGGSCMPYLQLHQGRINEISVPSHLGKVLERSFWVVGVASEEDGSMLKFTRPQNQFGQISCEVHGLPHNGEAVKGIKHIEGGGVNDACFATHTDKVVYIWNLQKEKIHILEMKEIVFRRSGVVHPGRHGEVRHDTVASNPWVPFTEEGGMVRDIAVANKDSGSLLFVGTNDVLAVWSFEKGKLCGPDGEETTDRTPLVVYRDEARQVDVDQSVTTTEFLVDLRDNDYTCAVWNLKGVDPFDLALQPRGPASLLAAPQRKEMLLDLWHSSKITQFRVAEDPEAAGGPCLIVACHDGSVKMWDLEGVDKGEIYADLRSLRPLEILLPVILLVVSFFQVISFAFGPSIEWRDEVKTPAYFTQKIVWGEFDWVLRFPREEVFLPMLYCVLGMICLFMVVTLTGMPELLNYCIHLTQSTRAYRYESRRHANGKWHLLKWALEALRWPLYTMVWLMSTILVAPVFKVCAQAVSCVPFGVDEDRKEAHLVVAPGVDCWQGTHWYIAVAVFTLVPAYFMVLIPFSVVEGDARYMSVRKLCFPHRYWAESAHRKATRLNFGPLHPNPSTIFLTLFLDLASRAVLPVIETWTAPRPYTQMFLITFVGTVMYVSSLRYPPKNHEKFSCLVRGTRLFTLCAMLCGCLTVALPKGSFIPMLILAVCLVLVPLLTVWELRRSTLMPPEVQQCHTVDQQPEAETNWRPERNSSNSVVGEEVNVVWIGDMSDNMSNFHRERGRMGTLTAKRVVGLF